MNISKDHKPTCTAYKNLSEKPVFNAEAYHQAKCLTCHNKPKTGRSFKAIKDAFYLFESMSEFKSLTDEEIYQLKNFLSEKVVVEQPTLIAGKINIKFIQPVAHRRMLISKFRYLFVNNNKNFEDIKIEKIIDKIKSRVSSIGGTCGHYFEGCIGSAADNANAKNLPIVSVIRRGVITNICSNIMQTDRAIETVLAKIGLNSSGNATEYSITKLMDIYIPGRIINNKTRDEVLAIFTTSKSLGKNNIESWRYVNYALCVSPTFELF